MAAEFKSHVLRRDEKGFFGIPFKRLLLAGVGGGLTYTVFNLAFPSWSIPAGVVAAVCFLILTGARSGLPLWQRMMYRVRGSLLLAATQHPNSLSGKLARSLELPLDLVRLEGSRVFAPVSADAEIDLSEWVTFSRAGEADRDDGLVFVESPLR